MTEQRTDAWYQARLAKVTASRVADVIAKTKSGYSASRDNYMADLIVERLTNQKASSFSNAAMEWGTATEPAARAAYSAATGELVEEVGFIDHPRIANSGASPDGLVGDEGLCEFKCPATATHLDTLLAGTVPSKYIAQMQWQMACTGRAFCDFASYDPRLPDHLRLFVKRVERDDAYIRMLEGEVTLFLSELEEKVTKLQELKRG
jgi:putative phage-type endonuclease